MHGPSMELGGWVGKHSRKKTAKVCRAFQINTSVVDSYMTSRAQYLRDSIQLKGLSADNPATLLCVFHLALYRNTSVIRPSGWKKGLAPETTSHVDSTSITYILMPELDTRVCGQYPTTLRMASTKLNSTRCALYSTPR